MDTEPLIATTNEVEVALPEEKEEVFEPPNYNVNYTWRIENFRSLKNGSTTESSTFPTNICSDVYFKLKIDISSYIPIIVSIYPLTYSKDIFDYSFTTNIKIWISNWKNQPCLTQGNKNWCQ